MTPQITMQQFTIVILAMSCSMITGCVIPGGGLERIEAYARPDLVDKLKVLHVGAELAQGAGYPITRKIGITSEHLTDDLKPNVSVDGLPMVSAFLPPFRTEYLGPRLNRYDWRIVTGVSEQDRFEPNVIDPKVELKVGDKVYIGGFPFYYHYWSQKDFLRQKPLVIETTVVELNSKGREWGGLVLVKAPVAWYNGFSGGPAAIIDDSGTIRVWGTMIGYLFRWKDWNGLEFVLCVAPLPRDFMDNRH